MTSVFVNFVRRFGLAVLAIVALAWAPPAAADIYMLVGGGQVRGEAVTVDPPDPQTYTIKLASGGKITLARNQVKQVIPEKDAMAEYERLRPSFAETVDGQWKAAEWCREHKLDVQRREHLERLLKLDPTHEVARKALGFQLVGGQWVQPDDVMAARGYVRHKGSWRTPQEIQISERLREKEVFEKGKAQDLRRRRGLVKSRRATPEEFFTHLRQLNDPFAVPGLIALYQAETEPTFQLAYIETLARIDTPPAVTFLIDLTLSNVHDEVRYACLERFSKNSQPHVARVYIENLKSMDNQKVKRAGLGLKFLKDPTAVQPLIESLTTVHQYKVSSGSPDQISAGFGKDNPGGGGNGLSVGGGPKIIKRSINNDTVLDALVSTTGKNFLFDQQAWRDWYASQNRPASLDLRRD